LNQKLVTGSRAVAGVGMQVFQCGQLLRKERAVGAESSLFRQLFKRDLHATLVNNLGRIGLLTERILPRPEAFGIRPAPAS